MSCSKILGRLKGGQGTADAKPYILKPSAFQSDPASTAQTGNPEPCLPTPGTAAEESIAGPAIFVLLCLGKVELGEVIFLFTHSLPLIFSDLKIGSWEQQLFGGAGQHIY